MNDQTRPLPTRRAVLGGTVLSGTVLGTVGVVSPVAARAAAADTAWWVRPDGDDAHPGTRTRPFRTIARAQRAVREARSRRTGKLTVNLYGGRYELTEPLVFEPSDGGAAGSKVVYRAVPGETPIIDGGHAVTGWEPHDPSKNIWRARVDLESVRQFWVNGRRAVRARSADLPAGFTMTETGYDYTGSEFDFANWRNLDQVELVSFRRWRSYRCRIAAVQQTDAGSRIDMQNPCWQLAYEDHNPWGNITLPVWVENAYELLDSEGEWYHDSIEGYLYYKPRAGEDITSAVAVLGKLETLLDIRGELGAPVRDLRFDGITFSHATWLEPNSTTGFAVIQAGYHRLAADQTVKLPANVTMRYAERIDVRNCRFEHLGGSGLELEVGTRETVVIGNRFEDISGNAIQVSGTDEIHHHPDDDRSIVYGNRIVDNYVTDAASEYHGCVGIWVGYADTTTIQHNTLAHLPYTAISIGWGWGTVDPGGSAGYTTPTTSRNNDLSYNHVHDFTERLIDGGGIYTLSAQPDSVQRGNFIHHEVLNHYDDSLVYLDEATRYYRVEENVLCSTPSWWLKIWTSTIRDNRVTHNYFDRPDAIWDDGVDNVIENNTLLETANIPDAAEEIAARSGVTPEYRELLGVPAPPSVAEVCDPTFAGQPPLGPPWTP